MISMISIIFIKQVTTSQLQALLNTEYTNSLVCIRTLCVFMKSMNKQLQKGRRPSFVIIVRYRRRPSVVRRCLSSILFEMFF